MFGGRNGAAVVGSGSVERHRHRALPAHGGRLVCHVRGPVLLRAQLQFGRLGA